MFIYFSWSVVAIFVSRCISYKKIWGSSLWTMWRSDFSTLKFANIVLLFDWPQISPIPRADDGSSKLKITVFSFTWPTLPHSRRRIVTSLCHYNCSRCLKQQQKRHLASNITQNTVSHILTSEHCRWRCSRQLLLYLPATLVFESLLLYSVPIFDHMQLQLLVIQHAQSSLQRALQVCLNSLLWVLGAME